MIRSVSRLLRACAALGALLVLAGPAPMAIAVGGTVAQEQGPAWPQFQGDAEHTAYVPDGPQPPYEVAWRYEPTGFGGFSGAVVANGAAFAVSAKKVVAVDLQTGEELWAVDRADGPVTIPAIASGEKSDILVYSEGKGAGTLLVGARADTGEREWELELEDDSTTGVTLTGTTALVGNDVGQVSSVDVETGEAAWTTEEPAGKVATGITVADGMAVYAVSDEVKRVLRFVAVDLATGEKVWMTEPEAVGATAFSVADGLLVTATLGFYGGQVLAVDPSSGAARWDSRMRAVVTSSGSTAVTDDRAFAVEQAVGVYGFDLSSGERVWDFQENGTAQVSGAPVVLGDHVVTGLQNGAVIAVDTGTGHLTWRSDVADDALRAPAVAGDLVVFSTGGPDGGMVALRHTDGQLLDEVSPTEFNASEVAKSFVVALVLVPFVLWSLGRLAGPWLWSRGGGVAEEADDLEALDNGEDE